MTYAAMNKNGKAYDCLQQALIANPFHASSYYRTGELLRSSNHIPSIMAGIMHLVLEPQSDRSPATFKSFMQLMFGSVQRTGENTTTITLDESMLPDKGSKKKSDNFTMQEMLFTRSAALNKDSVMNTIAKTEIKKFDFRLQLLINSLNENETGFFSERYVPFYKATNKQLQHDRESVGIHEYR